MHSPALLLTCTAPAKIALAPAAGSALPFLKELCPTVPPLVQVHVLDADAVLHLKLPCPLPLSWGRQVKPYDPACAWCRVMQQSRHSTHAQAPEYTAAERQAPGGSTTPRIPCKPSTGHLQCGGQPSAAAGSSEGPAGCPNPGHCSAAALVPAACPGPGSAPAAAAARAACPDPGCAAACADSQQQPAAEALACAGQTQAAAAGSHVHTSASAYDASAAPGGCQPCQSQLRPESSAEDKQARLVRVAALTADVLRGLGSTFMAVLISAGTLPITAHGLLAFTAANFCQASHSAVLTMMLHARSLIWCRTLHAVMAAVSMKPSEHHALQKHTASPAVPGRCHLCLTLCGALPPGSDVCSSSRSALHWTPLPLQDICPVGFIFVWLAKTDIQAAFQQMEHWVSHYQLPDQSSPPNCHASLKRHDAAEMGNVITILGLVLQAWWCAS